MAAAEGVIFPVTRCAPKRESASRRPGPSVLALPALVGVIAIGYPRNLSTGRPSIQVKQHVTVNQAIGKHVIHCYGMAAQAAAVGGGGGRHVSRQDFGAGEV